ncbi:MAG: ABC transporter ATP-binding protein, partial [Tomitella sp.]|nr:ABC transporter ATP-binding protein [Tomitella sp.]
DPMSLDTQSTIRTGVTGLTVRIPTGSGGRTRWVHAATDVSITLPAGTVTALVGESGCGKSILASTLCGLLPAGSRVDGRIHIEGQDMSGAGDKRWRKVRGGTVGLAAQSASTSFTPTRTIGSQLDETIGALGADTTSTALLEQVNLTADVARMYPHELSGGMAQRVGLAAAIIAAPPVLVADEPTAGLDPDTTSRILTLLRARADAGAAVLLITHDLQALEHGHAADQLAVMYAGRIVEHRAASDVLAHPRDAYTRALLDALPSRGLHPIPGSPPELTGLDDTYTFADRLTGDLPSAQHAATSIAV